jgi:hypothetical protein
MNALSAPALEVKNRAEALAYLNGLVTQQALMIGYLDDFKFMAIVTLLCVPLLLMLRKPRMAHTATAATPAAME